MQWSSTVCRHLLVLAGFAGGKLGKGERERDIENGCLSFFLQEEKEKAERAV